MLSNPMNCRPDATDTPLLTSLPIFGSRWSLTSPGLPLRFSALSLLPVSAGCLNSTAADHEHVASEFDKLLEILRSPTSADDVVESRCSQHRCSLSPTTIESKEKQIELSSSENFRDY